MFISGYILWLHTYEQITWITENARVCITQKRAFEPLYIWSEGSGVTWTTESQGI